MKSSIKRNEKITYVLEENVFESPSDKEVVARIYKGLLKHNYKGKQRETPIRKQKDTNIAPNRIYN